MYEKDVLSTIFIVLGSVACLISIIFSRKIYQKSFYENKIVSTFFGKTVSSKDFPNETVVFNLFAMLIELSKSEYKKLKKQLKKNEYWEINKKGISFLRVTKFYCGCVIKENELIFGFSSIDIIQPFAIKP